MHTWIEAEDRVILRGVAAGFSARQIAAKLGVTRNMIIGRHGRLRHAQYPSEVERRLREVEATAKRQDAYRAYLAVLLAEFDRRISRGEPRNWVIASACSRGVRYADAARHLGFSREYIRQICGCFMPKNREVRNVTSQIRP